MEDDMLRAASCALLSCLAAACGGQDPALAPDATLDATVPSDAAPLDAATTGRMLVSWVMLQEGALDPTLTCADLGTALAVVQADDGLWQVTPCDDQIFLSPPLAPGTYDRVQVLLANKIDGLYNGRARVWTDEPVTVTAGETTYVPLVFRLFDEPIPQLQEMCAAATAFYQASPEPKAFPPYAPHTPPLFACCETGGICPPNPDLWTSPPFSDLGFSVPGLSRFSYLFNPGGAGPDATVRIQAIGDYDCDAGFRTYTIDVSIAPDGTTVVGCDTITVDDRD